MIRLATIEDKEKCLLLAKEHISHVGRLTKGEEVNDTIVDNLATYVLTKDDGICFVYEENNEIIGLLAGIIDSPTLNTNKYLVECLFVFEPGKGAHSIKLINAAKNFVIDAGLDGLILGHMSDAGDRIEKLYSKLGLNELERKYLWTPNK